jgi:hypothetical protein
MLNIMKIIKERMSKTPQPKVEVKDYSLKFIEEVKCEKKEMSKFTVIMDEAKQWSKDYEKDDYQTSCVGNYCEADVAKYINSTAISSNNVYSASAISILNNLYSVMTEPPSGPPALDLLSEEVLAGLEAGKPKI